MNIILTQKVKLHLKKNNRRNENKDEKINNSNHSSNRNVFKQPTYSIFCKESIEFLRGGGCGASQQVLQEEITTIIQIELPNGFLEKFQENCDLLVKKAKLLLEGQQSLNSVMISIQWFHYNGEFFNTCCQSKKYDKSIYDLFLEKAEELLRILPIYIRSQCFLAYRILQIVNEILRVLFAFQFNREDRVLEEQKQKSLLDYVQNIHQELEIENNFTWKTGIEYEIKLIENLLYNSQIDHSQGTGHLHTLILNLVKCVGFMEISENLVDSMIEGGKYLFKYFYSKIRYPKEDYYCFYYFQTLKWIIIDQIKQGKHVNTQIQQLISGYQAYVQSSKNWVIHYSWIQMICDLLAYRVVIFKDSFIQNTDQFAKQHKWNKLIENKLLKQISSQNYGVLQLYTNNQFIDYDLKDLFAIKNQIVNFQKFSDALMYDKFSDEIDLWNFYTNFTFENQKETNLTNDSQLLQQKIGLEQLQALRELLLSNQQDFENFICSFQTLIGKSQKSQQEVLNVVDELKSLAKQIWNCTITILYLANEINYTFRLVFQQIKLIYERSKVANFSDEKGIKEINDNFDLFTTNFEQFILMLQQSQVNCLKVELYQNNYQQKNKQDLQQLQFEAHQSIFQDLIMNIEVLTINEKIMNQNIIAYFISVKQNFNQFTLQSCEAKSILDQILNQSVIILYFQETQNQNQADQLLQAQKQISFIQLMIELNRVALVKIYQVLQNYQVIINQQNATQKNSQSRMSIIKLVLNMLENQKKTFIIPQQIMENQLFQLINEFSNSLKYYSEALASINEDQSSEEEKEQKEQAFTLIKGLQSVIIPYLINPQNNQIDFKNVVKIIDDKIDEWSKKNKLEIKKEQYEQNNQEQYLQESLVQYVQNQEKILKEKLERFKQIFVHIQIEIILQEKKKQDQTLEACKILGQFSSIVSELVKEIISEIDTVINSLKKTIQDIPVSNFDYSELNFIFILNGFCQTINNKQIQNSQYLELLETINKTAHGERQIIQSCGDYKVRSCLLANLMKLQALVQDDNVFKFVQIQIKQIWIFEKDENVRNLLKNKDLLEMQQKLYSKDLKSLSAQIQSEIKDKLDQLSSLEQEIRLEGNEEIQKDQQQKLKHAIQDLDMYVENVSEMSEQMNIGLAFLKEVAKDVKEMKNKIDALNEYLKQLGQDIRKLRGKKYQELLEIRKKKVLQMAEQNQFDSVYVPLKTIEYHPITGAIEKTERENEQSLLLVEFFQDKFSKESLEGEVNEFLWSSKKIKDVLLLRGQAGSGKSRSIKKIEEFLWKMYGVQSQWIPIYVSLPQLKNPRFNLFEQALDSEYYNFDSTQIKEFKEAIKDQKEQVVFILDSYDEMKANCIQSNLISTNNFISDFGIQNPGKQMKFIIATRNEILNHLGYRTWFYGSNLENLKDVELIKFDENQIIDYLKQYVELSVRRKIKNLYEFIKQIQGQDFDYNEFQQIWKSVSNIVNNSNIEVINSQILFQNKEEEQIIQQLKSNKIFKHIKDEQTISIRKDLQQLWSCNMFRISIQSVNVSSLITTPFMLEIVVYVLPQMINREIDEIDAKEIFLKNLTNILKQSRKSLKMINRFKNNAIKNSLEAAKVIKKEKQFDEDLSEAQQIVALLEGKKFNFNFSLSEKIEVNNNIISVGNSKYDFGIKANLIVKTLKLKSFTIFEFYDCFIKFYHNQQITKLGQLGKISNYEGFSIDLFKYSQNFALDLTMNQQTQVNYKQQGKLNFYNDSQQKKNAWEEKYFNDSDESQEYMKMVRSCVLLSLKGTSYQFSHKSIQEFLVAKYIQEFLSQIKMTQNQIISIKDQEKVLCSLFNQEEFNVSKENYFGVMLFLRQQLEKIDQIDELLINIVKLSVKQEFIRTASNSICLLSNQKTFLGGYNFQNIQLSDTNLFALSFFGSDLSGSIFNNLGIDQCNFNFCNINNTKWTQINCSEKPQLKGHQQPVLVVTFSNDGKFLVSGGADGQAIIWDLKSFKEVMNIDHNRKENENFVVDESNNYNISKASILCLKLIKNDKYLLTAGLNTIISIFDIESKPQYILINELADHQSPIIQIIVSQDEKKIYSLEVLSLIIIWNVELIFKNTDIIIGEEQSEITNIALAPDGEYLFAIDKGLKQVSCYDVQKKSQLNFIPTNNCTMVAIALSKNEKFLAASDNNFHLFIWDVSQKQRFHLLYCEENFQNIRDLAISPDSQTLSVLYSDTIQNKRISDLKETQFEEFVQFKNYNNIAFSYLDDIFAIFEAKLIYFIDLISKQVINSISCNNNLRSLIFSQECSQFVYQDEVNNLYFSDIYSIQQKQNVLNFQSENNRIVFKNNLKSVLSVEQGHIIIRNIEAILKFHNVKQKCYHLELDCLTAQQNNFYFAFSSKSDMIIKDLSGDQVQTIAQFSFPCSVTCLAFSQSDLILLIGFEDGTILIGNEIKNKPQEFSKLSDTIKQLQLSHNDQMLGVLTSKNLKLYNLISKELFYTMEMINQTKIAFSPSLGILSFGFNQDVKFLDYETKKEIIKQSHPDKVIDLAFCPKHLYIVSISQDSTIILQNLQTSSIRVTTLFEEIKQVQFIDQETILTANQNLLRIWKITTNSTLQLFLNKLISGIQEFIYQRSLQSIIICQQNQISILSIDECCDTHISKLKQQNIAFNVSNDWKMIAYDCDKKIQLIKLGDHSCSQELELDNQETSTIMTFSKNDQMIANYGNDKFLKIWQLQSKSIIWKYSHSKQIYNIIFNEKSLIYEGEHILIWNITNINQIVLAEVFLRQKNLKDFQTCLSVKDNFIGVKQNENDITLRKWKFNQNKCCLFDQNEATKISYSETKYFIIQCIHVGSDKFQIRNYEGFEFNKTYYAFGLDISPDETLMAQDIFENGQCVFSLTNIQNKQKLSQFIKPESVFHKFVKFSSNNILLSANIEQIYFYSYQNYNLALLGRIYVHQIGFLFSLPQKSYFCISSKNKVLLSKVDKINQQFHLGSNLGHSFIALNSDQTILLQAFFFPSGQNFYQPFVVKIDLENFSKEEIKQNRIKKIVFLNNREIAYNNEEKLYTSDVEHWSQQQLLGQSQNVITQLSYSRKTQILASGDCNKKIMLWDIKGRQQIAVFSGHSQPINSIEFSHDGMTIASGSDDKIIRLWNVKAIQSENFQQGHSFSITKLIFSPDGQMLVSSSVDAQIRIWSIPKKRCLSVLNQHSNVVNSIEFSKEQTYLLSCDADNTIIVWNIENLNEVTYKIIQTNITLPIIQSIFTNQQLEVTSIQNSLQKDLNISYQCIWDLNLIMKQSKEDVKIKFGKIDLFKFIPQSESLIYIDKNQTKIFYIQDKTHEVLQKESNIKYIAFSKDGKNIASCTQNHQLSLWQQDSGTKKWKILKNISLQNMCIGQFLYYFEFSECNKKINFITQTQFLNCDLTKVQRKADDFFDLQLQNISCFQVDQKRMILAVAHMEEKEKKEVNSYQISLFDLKDSSFIKEYKRSQSKIQLIVFSHDDQYISACDKTSCIYVWNQKNQDQVFYTKVDGYLFSIQFIQNSENILLFCYSDSLQNDGQKGYFQEWNFKDSSKHQFLICKNNLKNMLISHYGKFLVIIEKKKFKLFEVYNIRNKNFSSQNWDVQEAMQIVFSPDETLLAICISFAVICVLVIEKQCWLSWELNSSVPSISQISFSTDGKSVFINESHSKWILLQIEEGKILQTQTYQINQPPIKELNIETSHQCYFDEIVIFQTQMMDDYIIILTSENILHRIYLENLRCLERCYFTDGQTYNPILLKNGIIYMQNNENVIVYDVSQKKRIDEINCDYYLSLSSDEQFAVLHKANHFIIIELSELRQYSQAKKFDAHKFNIRQSKISQNQQLLATGCEDSEVKIWNISDRTNPKLQYLFMHNYRLKSEQYYLHQLEFSFDSQFILSYYDFQGILVQLKNMQVPKKQSLIQDKLLGIQKYNAKDSKQVLLFVAETELYQFDERNSKKVKTILTFQPKAVCYSFCDFLGIFAYVRNPSQICVSWIENLELTKSILLEASNVRVLAFSFEGEFLLSGDKDCLIKQWNIIDCAENVSSDNLSDEVSALAFSPDGMLIASGTNDGSVSLHIQNALKSKLKKKQCELIKYLGDLPQIGCIATFSKLSLLQAKKCDVQQNTVYFDDPAIYTLFAQKSDQMNMK